MVSRPKTLALRFATLAVSSAFTWSATSAANSLAAGELLPELEIAALDGSHFSSQALVGKVAVVDLWSTWCGPYLKEIPRLNDLVRRYSEEGLAVVGDTLQSGWAQDIKKDLEERNIHADYPLLVGNDDVEEAFGGVLAFPTTLLIGRDGRILKKYVGADEEKPSGMEREIRALLAASDDTL